MNIHPTAIVHEDAQLDDGVQVHPFSIIGAKVRIGGGTVVGPHCVVEGDTTIGDNNRLYSGAQIGVASQDLKHDHRLDGPVSIGASNVFREHVTISAATMTGDGDEGRITSIGDGCLFMAYSHVGHDCHVGSSVIMANCASLAGHVTVEDKVIIGGLSGIHQDCKIGALAFIGGLTRINKDVPPYMIMEGVPARCFGPNSVGLGRNGFDEDARSRVRNLYKILYRSNLNVSQALAEIEANVEPCDEREHMLSFVRSSKRGIIK